MLESENSLAFHLIVYFCQAGACLAIGEHLADIIKAELTADKS